MAETITEIERLPGDRIRVLREQRGMKQISLARASGLSPKHLCFIETGRADFSSVRTGTLAKIAHGLGMSMPKLIGEIFKE